MKLIALGDNCVDYYCGTGEYYPGGNAVNVAVHAARLGARAEYLGNLAGDGPAAIIARALEENGVAYSSCPRLPDTTTKICRYNVVNGERSFVDVIAGPDWAGPIQLGARELALLSAADIVVSGCNAKLAEQLAVMEGLRPVFAYDFGEKEKYRSIAYYDQVCRGIDLAMFSCPELNEEAFRSLCAPLHQRGIEYVLATMGAKGQILSDGENLYQKPMRQIDARDTMGAGDSFLAAFLCSLYGAGWRKGSRMPRAALMAALEQGQRVSAQNCLCAGGFGGMARIFPNM